MKENEGLLLGQSLIQVLNDTLVKLVIDQLKHSLSISQYNILVISPFQTRG